MKLTKEEKQIILEKRREEDLSKPVKIGYLKHDLYRVPDEYFYLLETDWMITKEQKEQIIAKLDNKIKLDLTAGEEFDCYLENGREAWYDSETGSIAGADNEWAEIHLEKIKVLRKSK